MEITIYYGGEMPQRIKDAFFNVVGMELVADFQEGENDTDSTTYGNYFGGDLKDESEMRAEMKEAYTDAFRDGYFTMNHVGKAVALIDILCPDVDWRVEYYEKSHIKGQIYRTWKRFFEGEGAHLLKRYTREYEIANIVVEGLREVSEHIEKGTHPQKIDEFIKEI